MTCITFYLDFISPYAYLAFEQLPRALEGLSYQVRYKPLLFAGLLRQHGQLGPAEIPGKREWTYRQVQWQAHELGLPLDLPAAHPFNPLALLRLALACDVQGEPNRYVCETVFRHVWRGGAAADDPARLAALQQQLADQLQPGHAPDSALVKQQLQAHGAEALAQGVFGVPSFCVDGRLFWGLDALPMLRAWLQGEPWLAAHWDDVAQVGPGVRR